MASLAHITSEFLSWFQKYIFSISFYSSTIAFAGGIFFGEQYFVHTVFYCLSLVCLGFAYCGLRSRTHSVQTLCFTLALVSVFYTLGYSVMGDHITTLKSTTLTCTKTCTQTLRIIKPPEVYERYARVIAETETGIRVEFVTQPTISYTYNDYLDVSGTYTSLKQEANTDSEFSQFDRGRYLEGTLYTVSYPTITYNRSGSKNALTFFYQFREQIKDNLSKLIPSPENALVLGMVLGDKTHVPKDLTLDLSRVGILHIIVVSGYNISLIINLVLHLLRKTSRRVRFTTTYTTLALFVILVGFEPSVLRAAGMASVLLIGKIIFKPVAQIRTLIAVAVILVFISPHLLFHSISFQFSFCATLGLILFSNFFNSLFCRVRPVFIREILAQSCASQVLIAPLLLFYMQSISLISPLTNLLVLPVVPFITVVGGVTVLISFLSTPLALLLGYILYIPSHYIVFISTYIGSWTFITFESAQFGIPTLIALYTCIGVLVLFGTRFNSNKKLP